MALPSSSEKKVKVDYKDVIDSYKKNGKFMIKFKDCNPENAEIIATATNYFLVELLAIIYRIEDHVPKDKLCIKYQKEYIKENGELMEKSMYYKGNLPSYPEALKGNNLVKMMVDESGNIVFSLKLLSKEDMPVFDYKYLQSMHYEQEDTVFLKNIYVQS